MLIKSIEECVQLTIQIFNKCFFLKKKMRVYLQVVKSLGIQFSVFDVLAQIFFYLNSVHVMPVPLYTSAF